MPQWNTGLLALASQIVFAIEMEIELPPAALAGEELALIVELREGLLNRPQKSVVLATLGRVIGVVFPIGFADGQGSGDFELGRRPVDGN